MEKLVFPILFCNKRLRLHHHLSDMFLLRNVLCKKRKSPEARSSGSRLAGL